MAFENCAGCIVFPACNNTFLNSSTGLFSDDSLSTLPLLFIKSWISGLLGTFLIAWRVLKVWVFDAGVQCVVFGSFQMLCRNTVLCPLVMELLLHFSRHLSLCLSLSVSHFPPSPKTSIFHLRLRYLLLFFFVFSWAYSNVSISSCYLLTRSNNFTTSLIPCRRASSVFRALCTVHCVM